MASKPTVAVIGTCDTKLEETLFLHEQVTSSGACAATIIDVGAHPASHPLIAASAATLLGQTLSDLSSLSRAAFVDAIIPAATAHVRSEHAAGRIHAVVAAGGSTGTSVAAAVMRATVPVGCPKLVVSTMAAGDTSAYVGSADVTLMYSVVDIAGLNWLSRSILANAAAATEGMARAYFARCAAPPPRDTRRRVAMSMFGVTTAACDRIREALTRQHGCEVVVFHATGAGGRALEKLVGDGAFDAVVDLTTTEVADELVGGVLSAGPERLRAAARRGVPLVVSVGACDMVNFGPAETVPQRWRDQGRLLHVHNPAVTLMRTSPDECEAIGRFIARALAENAVNPGAVKVLFPLKGVSVISEEGGPFYDAEADARLRKALEQGLQGTGIEMVAVDHAINDEEFAAAAVSALAELMAGGGG